MATVTEMIEVIGFLYPQADREIVNGVLIVDPTIDTTLIDFDLEYQNLLLERKKETLIDKVRANRETVIENGMSYTFGTVVDGIQIRSRDLTILLALSVKAKTLTELGVVDPVFVFRSLNDNEYMLTPLEITDLTNAVDAFVSDLYSRSWAIKNSIRDATTLADLNLIVTDL